MTKKPRVYVSDSFWGKRDNGYILGIVNLSLRDETHWYREANGKEFVFRVVNYRSRRSREYAHGFDFYPKYSLQPWPTEENDYFLSLQKSWDEIDDVAREIAIRKKNGYLSVGNVLFIRDVEEHLVGPEMRRLQKLRFPRRVVDMS